MRVHALRTSTRIGGPRSSIARYPAAARRTVRPDVIAKAFGAEEIVSRENVHGAPIGLHALRRELESRVRSTGGRPALDGATKIQKIPLKHEDWSRLEDLATRRHGSQAVGAPWIVGRSPQASPLGDSRGAGPALELHVTCDLARSLARVRRHARWLSRHGDAASEDSIRDAIAREQARIARARHPNLGLVGRIDSRPRVIAPSVRVWNVPGPAANCPLAYTEACEEAEEPEKTGRRG